MSQLALSERMAEARASGNLDAVTSVVPYCQFLGISASVVDGELIGKMSFSRTLIGNPALPALHGGTLGALLESTAIFELLWQSATVVLPKTINLTIDYLRSAAPVDTFCRGVVTRHGRRVANVRAEAWQEDRSRPVALASAHFLVMRDGD
jgi:acyl-coenzyme A thioesterase PaaI-like protein